MEKKTFVGESLLERVKFIGENGFLDAWRNRTFTWMIAGYSALCTLFFGLLGRGYLHFLHARIVEELASDSSELVSKKGELTLLLHFLEKASLFVSLVFFLLSFAYLLTLLSKEFIQQKKEFQIKSYIGTSYFENAGIFWVSYAFPYFIGELVGSFVAQLSYLAIILIANDSLKTYLLLPRYSLIWIDIPVFFIQTVFLIGTFFLIQKKMGGIENEENTIFVDHS